MLTTGSIFAERYEILHRLGEGAFGVVFEVRRCTDGQRFALKILHGETAPGPQALLRFTREARILTALDHPYVVKVIDAGVDPSAPYLVMELLSGETLGARMRRGRMETDEVIETLLALCSALDAVHALGVTHRDLKPDNVMLARISENVWAPKLLDFGIAKAAEQFDDATHTRAVMGTPRYMSPEQAIDSKHIDHRSDLWSLGVIAWEMLAGTRLFNGPHKVSVLSQVIEGNVRRLRTERPDLPAALDDAIHRALSRDPAARPSSATEFARALMVSASESTAVRWAGAFDATTVSTALLPAPPTCSTSFRHAPAAIQPTRPAGEPSPSTLQPAAHDRTLSDRPRLAPAAALIAATLGAVALVASTWRSTPRTATNPAVGPAVTIAMSLRIEPRDAQIALDGVPVAVGALDRTIPRDGRMHTLRVSRDGYETQSISFVETLPASVVVLHRLAPVTLAATQPPRTATPTAPAGATTRPPASPPERRHPSPPRSPEPARTELPLLQPATPHDPSRRVACPNGQCIFK